MRVSHSVRHACRSLYERRAPVDGELSLAIQDYKHLLALVVEVLSYAAVRLNDAAMEKDQVRFHRVSPQHRPKGTLAGARMYGLRLTILARITAHDAVFDVSRR
jgi:hypothetical protein